MIAELQSHSHDQHTFLSETIICHGPSTLLGRFFLKTALFAKERDINLSLCQPEELYFVNQKNRESWMPLVPMYDPSFNKLDNENYIGLLGRTERGEIVTANAVRLYDWTTTNFLEEATSLRLMYDAPVVSKQPGESCKVNTPSAGFVRGRAAFSGAAWVHPNFRGRGLGHMLPLTIKALALTKWWPDTVFGMMSSKVHEAGFAEPFGFGNSELEIVWKSSSLGDLRLALLWTDREHILSDVRTRLDESLPQIDRGILGGNSRH
jgi:hypothetical protein